MKKCACKALKLALKELQNQWNCSSHRNGDECGHADSAKEALDKINKMDRGPTPKDVLSGEERSNCAESLKYYRRNKVRHNSILWHQLTSFIAKLEEG